MTAAASLAKEIAKFCCFVLGAMIFPFAVAWAAMSFFPLVGVAFLLSLAFHMAPNAAAERCAWVFKKPIDDALWLHDQAFR